MAPKEKRKRNLLVPASQLPIDVLDNIIKKLDSPVDIVSFSCVCKLWHYVALGRHLSLYCKLPMHHFAPWRNPLPMLLHPGAEGLSTYQLQSLNPRKKYGSIHLNELSNKWIVGSSAGWLVTVDTADPKVNLLNPLTGKKILLPHLSTLPRCDLKACGNNLTTYSYIRKAIVCSYQGNFLVVALVSEFSTIRFCKIGDSKWTSLENSPLYVNDIIMHNGKLYAVNRLGAVFEICISNPPKVTMHAMPGLPTPGGKYYLVDVGGELLIIARVVWRLRCKRESQSTNGFDVFKLVEDESSYSGKYESEAGMKYAENVSHSLVEIGNIGHHIVFVGYNYSLSFDSRVYPHCRGNCIYFADYRYEADCQRMSGQSKKIYHDVGVYHMKKPSLRSFENSSGELSTMNMVWLSPNFSSELDTQMIPR